MENDVVTYYTVIMIYKIYYKGIFYTNIYLKIHKGHAIDKWLTWGCLQTLINKYTLCLFVIGCKNNYFNIRYLYIVMQLSCVNCMESRPDALCECLNHLCGCLKL